MQVAAQILSIIAMSGNIFSYQQKTKNMTLLFQLFSAIMFSVSFFLFGAFSGALMNILAMIRVIIFLNNKKLHTESPFWFILFCIIYVLSYIASFTLFGKEFNASNAVIEILPVIGMTVSTYSFQKNDNYYIRRYGLINSPLWLIYNILTFSIGAIICEIFTLSSIIIGIYRFDRKEKQ